VIVAASTDCFPGMSLEDAVDRLVGLEYTGVEIAIKENGRIKPSAVLADLEGHIQRCRDTQRLTTVAYDLDLEAGPDYYKQFAACCKLAKANKVVTLTVPAGELGTPFNAEIERLRELVAIATKDAIVVGVKTEVGRISQDPDTAVVLCNNVKGLGITLDPSHFICGPHKGASYDQVLPHVVHVHLRDTKKDAFQVRVGQGEVEYGRLVTQLSMQNYNRGLSVSIPPMEGVDHTGEMRKMRLLLESLL
jgi:sugar phosphate isomerase/epimerase